MGYGGVGMKISLPHYFIYLFIFVDVDEDEDKYNQIGRLWDEVTHPVVIPIKIKKYF